MIICFRNGRLGNQIFQYAFLKNIAKKKEKIVLVGFSELKLNFETKNTIFLFSSVFWTNFMFPKIKIYNLDKVLSFISNKLIPNLYLFKILEFDDKKNNFKINPKFALCKYVVFTKNFFAQTESYANKEKLNDLKFLDKNYQYSKKILKNKNNSKRKNIFIHIRLMDYKEINHGMKIDLSLEWYFDCIKVFEKKFNNPFFIILSDDKNIYKNFQNKDKFYCSRNNFEIDFCLMSLCDGGILSASSFSWWGAWFAKQNNSFSYFIGPNYWMGFYEKKWFPKYIKSKFIDYKEA